MSDKTLVAEFGLQKHAVVELLKVESDAGTPKYDIRLGRSYEANGKTFRTSFIRPSRQAVAAACHGIILAYVEAVTRQITADEKGVSKDEAHRRALHNMPAWMHQLMTMPPVDAV